jgi:hypothetical protein
MHMSSPRKSYCYQSNSSWPAELAIEEVNYSLLNSLFVNSHIITKIFVYIIPFLIHYTVICRYYFPILRW